MIKCQSNISQRAIRWRSRAVREKGCERLELADEFVRRADAGRERVVEACAAYEAGGDV